MNADYRVRATLWRYPGKGGWHFVTVPAGQSSRIRKRFGMEARGWGSLPARVRIGGSEWRTSLFPDSKTRTYLIPVKAAVRQAERIGAGDAVTVEVSIDVDA